MNVGEDGRVAAVARVPAGEDDADADTDTETDAGEGSPEVAPDGAAAPVPADEALDTPDADSAGPGDDTASE